MRLLRLVVADFAAIANAEIEFGPGLNILYGPNDLGKSTLADSLRMGLLLPHTSTHIEPFVSWSGGQHPRVEITFETEAQRIWKVVKTFGKSGSSVLHESRNGVEFDETARGRQVDARLREILRWGIPEPGGSGAGRGMPTSFLATALLSTQAHVGAILDGSLEADTAQSGRERIASALQAVAQDPIFVSLLRRTQDWRDLAYTEKGAKKTSRDSPFKKAAERLRLLRDEKEPLQRVVEESQSVEHHLQQLTSTREIHEGRVAALSDELAALARLVKERTAVDLASEQVRVAGEQVSRIRKIDSDIQAAELVLAELGRLKVDAEERVAIARRGKAQADAALGQAVTEGRAAGGDPQLADTVARQTYELRRSAATQVAAEAQQRIEAATAAQRAIDAAAQAERDLRECSTAVDGAAAAVSQAEQAEHAQVVSRQRLELLERALAVRSADERLAAADGAVQRIEALRLRLASTGMECRDLEARRAALVVPAPAVFSAIRRLSAELAAARAVLDVGLVVTVRRQQPIALRLQKDGISTEVMLGAELAVIEADARVDLDLAGLASITVQGGRRDAVEKVQLLEQRWAAEATSHLQAAQVDDLESLEVMVAEARDLDSSVATTQSELRSLDEQVATLGDPLPARQRAASEAQACRMALGNEPLEPLLNELSRLGQDAGAVLRRRKESAAKQIDGLQHQAGDCRMARSVAEERQRAARAAVQAASPLRDAAIRDFPTGPASTLKQAQLALAAATAEQRAVTVDLATLETRIAAESARVEAAVAAARGAVEDAARAVEAAETHYQKAIGDHTSQSGSIEQFKRRRAEEDLDAATQALRAATEHQSTLPLPSRAVTEADVAAAAQALDRAKTELTTIESEVHKAHGALEQVGGAVARERLREVIEAYEAAERAERETEADYEAWKLLLETMKAADAAQASNLGHVLAPAVASRFETLTEKRYEGVKLTAQLATEGVVVRGTLRPAERMSVGTREQLSTLYRLALAEYLGSAVVLDDQLVQSDDLRMDWFRELLVDKAAAFQIVVFTCRPGDYLRADATQTTGAVANAPAAGIRVVDLGQAIQRGASK